MMSLKALGPLKSGSGAAKLAADYYENSADYYLKDTPEPEKEGQWIGRGAARLGLTGSPDREQLQLAFAGYLAGREVQNAGQKDRQMGWDLTFSAPKSVSIAWAAANPSHRAEIEMVHRKATLEAFYWLESQTSTRRGHAGKEREPAYLASSLFTHYTSREGDPQLHSHIAVPNFCIRGDGTVGTIESKHFYDMKLTAGALYQAELAARMRELRYRIEPGSKGTFRLTDVDADLEKVYSKRGRQIDQASKESGIETYAGTRKVVLSTRKSKQESDLVERRATWEQEAKAAGHVFGVKRSQEPIPIEAKPEEIKKKALEKLTDQNSTFQEKDFIREVARASYGSLDVREIFKLENNAMRDGFIKRLGQDKYGRHVYTTREMLALETRMVESVETLANRKGCRGAELDTMYMRHLGLNKEQQLAVHSATGDQAIVVIQGRAGVGKTRTLTVIRESYKRAGWNVQGLAVAGRAAQNLEKEAGIESHTIASWKDKYVPQKTVLVVDEAGMVGSRGMTELLGKAKQAGAKVILVGDERQLQPIDAGGALHAVDQKLLDVKPKACSKITTILRQNEEWMRDAVYSAAKGETRKALQAIDSHGRMNFYTSAREAKEELVKSYLERERATSEALILTNHKNDARQINEAIREKLQEKGVIGKDVCQVDNGQRQVSLAVGDRVMFTRNDYKQDVRNGQRGIVFELDEKRAGIRLDDGTEKKIDLEKYSHVDYGWAMTTHKAQGATVDRAYLYGHSKEWMASQQSTYVQISRARDETLIYVASGERSVERPLDKEATAPVLLEGTARAQAFDEMSKTWGRDASKGTTLDYVSPVPEVKQELKQELKIEHSHDLGM